MDLLLFLLNDVIFVALEGATLLYLFLYVLGDLDFFRRSTAKAVFFIALYLVVGHVFALYREFPVTLLYVLFCWLVLAWLTKTNLYLSAIASVIVFLLYGVTEVVTSIPALAVMGLPFSAALNNRGMQAKALLVIRPIQTLLIFLITRFRFNNSFFQRQVFRKDNSSSAYLFVVLLFMSLFYSDTAKYIENMRVLVTSGFLFLAVFVMGIMDTKERMKLLDIENQLKLQKEYSRSMELVIDAVRKEKHDYQNHLSTLVALCTMDEPEAIGRVKSYAQRLTNATSTSFRFYNTGNKYLDGLLAVKNNLAKDKGIFFEVDTEMTLEGIEVDDVDLTTIVGNIVDNAFDAVEGNPEESKKIVSLDIFEEEGKCYISISNNGPEISDVHKKHIFDYKYSTKSKGEGERGYGLFIVKELVDRNNGKIIFNSSEFETEFRILFRRSDKSVSSHVGSNNSLLKNHA